jgi:hypothetical protein
MPVAEKRETSLEGLLEKRERIVAALAPCACAARCLASYHTGESLAAEKAARQKEGSDD